MMEKNVAEIERVVLLTVNMLVEHSRLQIDLGLICNLAVLH